MRGRAIRWARHHWLWHRLLALLAPRRGKTKTARLWTYLIDERPWAGDRPPAAFYRFSRDRKGERPRDHLTGFHGIIQADAYGGYEALTRAGQPPGILLAACWAHARRKTFDVFAATGSPIAQEALRRITELYAITRRNFLFLGSEVGGERAAILYTALETAKLNGLDPEAWLADVIDCMAKGHPINRLGELLPWNWEVEPARIAAVRGYVRVFYYIPALITPVCRVLIALHGLDRVAAGFRDEFIAEADRLGKIVIVPEFDIAAFPDVFAYNYGNVVTASPNSQLNARQLEFRAD